MELLINLALLVTGLFAVSLTYTQTRPLWTWVTLRYALAVGTAFALMANTIPLAAGVIYDFRVVPVALASRRYGMLAGVAVALPIGLYRWTLGGPGVVPALINLLLVVILASPRQTWRTLTPPWRGENLYRCWWVPLGLFTLANLPTFLAFALAGRSMGDALAVYLSYTVLSAVGMILGHLVVQTRLQALSHAARLGQLASTDSLTGLYNRRQFDLDLPGASLASFLLLLDLDHFKRINDTYGHAAGDRVLIALAEVLRRSVRPADRVYRLGGEEFAVVLHDCHPDAAPLVSDRVRQRVALEVSALAALPGETITISGGLAPVTAISPLAEADARLYAAKAAGRNRVEWGRDFPALA